MGEDYIIGASVDFLLTKIHRRVFVNHLFPPSLSNSSHNMEQMVLNRINLYPLSRSTFFHHSGMRTYISLVNPFNFFIGKK